MQYNIADDLSLLLTGEEAMALLDLCLHSPVEITALQERALIKLANLARQYLNETAEGKRDHSELAAV